MVTYAEDNPFPSVLFAEHVDPSNPGAGTQRLFVDTDHVLKLIDSAGTVTTYTGASGAVATDAIWDAKGDLAGGTGANTASKLTVGSNDTILMADSSQTTGLKWVASQTPSTQAFSDSAAEGTADTYARGDHKHAMPASPTGGLVLLEQHTASSSATLDFTSFISSTYDEYQVEGVCVAPATNGDHMYFLYGTGGGPTYATADYYWGNKTATNGGSSASGTGGSSAGAQAFMEICHTVANNAGYGMCNFSFKIFHPQSTAAMKFFSGTVAWHDGAQAFMSTCGGLWGQTTALTAMRFKYSSGNIASGTIRIYGIAK